MIDHAKLDRLQRRICDRSTVLPRLMLGGAARSHLVAADHCSFVATAFFALSGEPPPELSERHERIIFAEPKRWHATTLAALRAWAGPSPVYMVKPCPESDVHEEEATGKRDPWECFYGCQFVPGLGYAYESQDREFGELGDADWGRIGRVIVDRARLAELLGPFDDCSVMWGVHEGALYVQYGGLWRVGLMSAAEDVEIKGPAFEEHTP